MSITVDEDIIRVVDHIQVDTVRELTLNAGITIDDHVIMNNYMEFREITEPADPGANIGRLYKKAGSNGIYWKTDIGVTEINLLDGYKSILYDAVISADGSADYILISTALAAGAKTIFVRDGNYVETGNLNIPDGGYLVGASKNAVITFVGSISGIVTDTSGGTITTGGTISAVNGSDTITGTSTNFTTLNPIGTNTYILIDNTSYLIASITNNTTLVLANVYTGKNISGSYKAHKVNNGFHIENLTIVGSNSGLFVRSARQAVISNITIQDLAIGVNITHCDNSSFNNIIVENSTTGMTLASNVYCNFNGCVTTNCSTNGIIISGTSKNIGLDSCNISNCGLGLYIDAPATNCIISKSSINNNNDAGIRTNVGSITCTIVECIIRNNASWGIDYDGTNQIIDTCFIDGNGDSGIRAGVDGIISNCQISNNAGYGIGLESNYRCVVSGNNIYSNGIDGIYCNDDNNDIVSNVIRNNGGNGIFLITASGNNITGNTILSNVGNGISLTTASINNNIVGNTLANNVVGCIVATGCNSTNIASNMIRSNTSHGLSIASNTSSISSNRCVLNGGSGCLILSGATDTTILSNNFQGNTGSNLSDNGTISSLEGILINEIDTRDASTLILGKATATRIELADAGIVTNAKGILEVTETLKADVATELTSGNGMLIENVRHRDGYVEFTDISAPANPGSALGRLYKKTGNDGIFWKPDGAGAEVDLTAPNPLFGSSASVSQTTTITTTSSAHILATDMSLTPTAGTYIVVWSASVRSTSSIGEIYIQIYTNGIASGSEQRFLRGGSTNNPAAGVCATAKVTVNGSQTIEGRWRRVNGTGEMLSRNLTIIQSAP